MPTTRGIAVGVLSDQVLLNEYEIQHTDEKTVSCFIASEPGKSFEILLTSNLHLQDVSVSIHVDGSYIGRFFLTQGQKILPGVYVSEAVTRPFRFRELDIRDTRQILDPTLYSWENVGTLDFNVYRCQKTGVERFRTQVSGSLSRTADHINRTPVPSTSNISTGVEVPIKPIQGVGGVTIDPPDQPFARIFFRYRPRDILVLQGVMQSTPSSIPQTNLSRSSSSTAVTTGSHSSRKRSSMDLMNQSMHDANTRPTQKARHTPSGSIDSRASSTPRPRSNAASVTWGVSPTMDGSDGGTSAELSRMKVQLRMATDQMDGAMKQMRSSLDQMNRCMDQMQMLQQRIEAIEARSQTSHSTPYTGQGPVLGYRTDSREDAGQPAYPPVIDVSMPWMPDQFDSPQEPRVTSWPT